MIPMGEGNPFYTGVYKPGRAENRIDVVSWTRELWEFLRLNPWLRKIDYNRWKHNGGDIPHPVGSCPICEYNDTHEKMFCHDYCLLKWPSKIGCVNDLKCMEKDIELYPFKQWIDAKGFGELRSELATQIRDLPINF